jgi:hypothetical protein
VEWRNVGMAEWRNGGMVIEWRNGRMVIELRNGRMRKDGQMAGMATYVLFTVDTHRRRQHRRQRRTLIFYSIEERQYLVIK